MRNLTARARRRRAAGCVTVAALLVFALPVDAAPKAKRAPPATPGASVKPSANRLLAPKASTESPIRAPTAPPIATFSPVDTSTPPPSLPRASRDRMRACAEEWDQKKLGSKTGLPMWRDFAAGCLTREEAPRIGAPSRKSAPEKTTLENAAP